MDIEKLKALKAEYEGALREHARSAFMDLFRRLFEEHPNLLTLEWCQYTPYFNDGEPCEFRVGSIEVRWVGMPGGDDEVEGWWLDRGFTEPSWDFPPELAGVEDALMRIPADVYLAAFGDHAEVFVTRKGVEVEEYASHS